MQPKSDCGEAVPAKIQELLNEERRKRSTGTVELHLKDGQVVGAKLIRILRTDDSPRRM